MQLVTDVMTDHEVLRRPASEIVFPLDDQVKQFMAEMQDFFTNLKSPFGKPAGLAATQVGKPLRIIIMQIPPEAKQIRKDVYDVLPLTFIINPAYVPDVSAGKTKDWEACYSVPDKMGEVYRYTSIHYSGLTPEGKRISGNAKGFLARLIQHEVGHLNGELYTDLICEGCRLGPADVMMKIRQAETSQSKS